MKITRMSPFRGGVLCKDLFKASMKKTGILEP